MKRLSEHIFLIMDNEGLVDIHVISLIKNTAEAGIRGYFYENGKYAEKITGFFDYMDYKIEKYIVSSDDYLSKNTISFDKVEFKDGSSCCSKT